ncbi:hypothetical protein CIHG_07721 [Coccidioides immitis H538.4]|uniref:Uncharacterized protein n=2 Tax=Coccidioides immitis TaxID=5501 RepID=A0A0J8RZ29_COCIT|nr:hypothetical protein CIRG_04194 [Coccidioides immitis RMSCC 2394]KMU90037.1 hypothetical protein CIHG_07721 [Coccidioides immitis H538.4]
MYVCMHDAAALTPVRAREIEKYHWGTEPGRTKIRNRPRAEVQSIQTYIHTYGVLRILKI